MLVKLISHPAIILLFLSCILTLTKRWLKVFNVIAISLPIIALIHLYNATNIDVIKLFGFHIIPLSFNDYNKFFAYGFLISYLASVIYALSNQQHSEIIAGSFYIAFGLLGVLAGDFISLFVGLEGMMIMASIIIFIGPYTQSKHSAMRYFIIHMISGTLFIAGIAILMHDPGSVFTHSLEILSINFSNNKFSHKDIAGILIILSCLINTGMPPFSYWITDSYPYAKSSGSVFLVTVTTKFAIYCLITLFPQQSFLIYAGIFMFVYGIIYAILEHNLRRILCYLLINQLGLMLIAVGVGSKEALIAASILALFHILYKSILMIIAGSFVDRYRIYDATELSIINIDLTSAVITVFAVLFLLGFPMLGSYQAKNLLSSQLSLNSHYLIYQTIIIFSPLSLLALPIKQVMKVQGNNMIKLSSGTMLSVLLLIISLMGFSIMIPALVYNLSGFMMPLFNHYSLIINQLTLMLSAVLLLWLLYDFNHKKPGKIISFDYLVNYIYIPKMLEWYEKTVVNQRNKISTITSESAIIFRNINWMLMTLSIGVMGCLLVLIYMLIKIL